jgi:hypothetical protein
MNRADATSRELEDPSASRCLGGAATWAPAALAHCEIFTDRQRSRAGAGSR